MSRHRAEGLKGTVKLREVSHHQEQLTEGQDARLHVARSDREDHRRPHRGGQTDQEAETAFCEGNAEARPNAFAGVMHVSSLLTVLLAERLYDADCRQHLLHHRHCGALEFVHFVPLAAQASAIGS